MLECAARAQASVEPPADPIRLRIQSAVGEVDAGITKCIDSVSHIRGLSLRLLSPRRGFSPRAQLLLSPHHSGFSLPASLPAPRLLSASSLLSLLLLFSCSSLLSASSLLSPGFSCRAADYLSLLLSPGRSGSLHCFSPRRVKSSNGFVKSSNFPCSSFLQQYSSFIPNKGR